MLITPSILSLLLQQARADDACEDWPDVEVDGADAGRCALDRLVVEPIEIPAWGPKVVDLTDRAASSKYADGRVKRTAFPRVVLAKRRVVVGLHQMGVEVPVSWPSWHKVTAHYVVLPDGSIVENHPIDVRLICTNRFDRAPWHCIGIEFAVNAEGVDGSGRWAGPAKNGRGRVSDRQVTAGRWLVGEIAASLRARGHDLEAVVPHRVAGRSRKGVPNRQICPGSRIWGEVGEWSAVEHSLAIPGPDFKLGGLTIPPEWRSPHYENVTRFLAA